MMSNIMWLSVFLGVLGVVFVSNFDTVHGQDNRHLLHTPYGTIVGLRETLVVSDRRPPMNYYAFKGIQYATAERWEESKLKELDEVQATTPGSLCPQWSVTGNTPVGNEKCLYLNIFTPTVPSQGVGATLSASLLPVMVYFHGGGYMYGDSTHAGPMRLMRQKKVVLVTCNYRLGVLGYLSTGDAEIGGNFGALDQITALQFIQKYISLFGGNPNRITIFGNSAGAASVHLLILSPRALGLFHGAIIQSGNALCPWAMESHPAEYAETYAEKLGCSGTTAEFATCLKGKSVQDLITAQNSLLDLWVFPIRTAPIVDEGWRGEDGFLPRKPEELMAAGAFQQVPILTGVVSDEGLMGYVEIHLEVGADKFKDAQYFDQELLPQMLSVMMDQGEESMDIVTDAVRRQYFEGINSENDTKRVISAMSDLIGDVIFYSCHRNFLEKLVASNTTAYSYVFTHKTPKSPSSVAKSIDKLRKMGVHPGLFDYGVGHVDENLYLFEPYEATMHRMEGDDLRVSDQIVNIWTSFATTWNPLNGRAAPWRPLREGNIEFYNIPENRTQEFRTGESTFWLRTVPYLQELGANITELELFKMLFWVMLGLFLLFLLVTLVLAIVLWRKRSSQAVNL